MLPSINKVVTYLLTYITMAKTNVVLDVGTREATERQLSTLKSITKEIVPMRIDVEAKKLAAK